MGGLHWTPPLSQEPVWGDRSEARTLGLLAWDATPPRLGAGSQVANREPPWGRGRLPGSPWACTESQAQHKEALCSLGPGLGAVCCTNLENLGVSLAAPLLPPRPPRGGQISLSRSLKLSFVAFRASVNIFLPSCNQNCLKYSTEEQCVLWLERQVHLQIFLVGVLGALPWLREQGPSRS